MMKADRLGPSRDAVNPSLEARRAPSLAPDALAEPSRSAMGQVLRGLATSATVTVAAALLTACGFHFAGSRPLPEALRSVYVETVIPYRVTEPPVEAALRLRLVRRGATVTSRPEDATCILRLSHLDERREMLSVGPDGKALEFLLTAQVRYELIGRDKILVPADSLSVSRDYFFNAQQVLAKEAEESRLREYIQSDLAELIMLRLEAQLARPQ
jgi:LPS-assembly lipoprotein